MAKEKRKLLEHWREWPGKEGGNKSERELKKIIIKSSFMNAVSIHYRCIARSEVAREIGSS